MHWKILLLLLVRFIIIIIFFIFFPGNVVENQSKNDFVKMKFDFLKPFFFV